MNNISKNFLVPVLWTIALSVAFHNYATAQPRDADGSEAVFLETQRIDDILLIYGVNSLPYPVTLTVEISGENYSPDRSSPVTLVLKAHQKRRLYRIMVKDKSKPLKLNRKYSWLVGEVNAKHNDAYIYRLPYQNNHSYELSQGYGGEFSHNGNSEYAVDFTMPVGTPVLAARPGIVVETYKDFDAGGPDIGLSEQSNSVVIIHDDGTFGVYAHLKKNGVTVEPGETIKKGQLIAYSGNTGYSSGPHLHFMVTKLQEDGTSVSVPFRFKAERGVVSTPREGEYYTAVK